MSKTNMIFKRDTAQKNLKFSEKKIERFLQEAPSNRFLLEKLT